MSKYDDLFNKYHSIRTTKKGTRYEILAAFAFKKIHQQGTVIHDMKLIGQSTVKHQIDVKIETAGIQKRVLIECKDFDISGDKVGLGIVRDFWGVVDDIHPDEAMIITCNGFTNEAALYAKSKNIKLAVLREFEEKDWQGRVKEVHITIVMPMISQTKISQTDIDTPYANEFVEQMTRNGIIRDYYSPEYDVNIIVSGQTIPASEFPLAAAMNAFQQSDEAKSEGWHKIAIESRPLLIEIQGEKPIPVSVMKIDFEVVHERIESIVGADMVGELILEGINDDMIIWGEEIETFTVNDNGTITKS